MGAELRRRCRRRRISRGRGRTRRRRSRRRHPGRKPARSSASITPIVAQAGLDVGQRLLVAEVVAGEQPLDAPPARRGSAPGPRASTSKLRPARRAEDHVLGRAGLDPRAGRRLAARARALHGARSPPARAAQLVAGPAPVALDVSTTAAHLGAQPLAPRARPALGLRPAPRRSAFDSATIRGSCGQARIVLRAARPRPSRSSRYGVAAVRPARRRPRGPAAACARRGRGSRGRARRPALAPSIRPGMSAITSWRSSSSSVPEHRLQRRERVVGRPSGAPG